MKTFIYLLALTTVAWTARGLAVTPAHRATLTYGPNHSTCEGEWYFSGKEGVRIWWTGGDVCDATYSECLAGTITDPRGTHPVLACSSDYELSRGRKAGY